MNAQRLHEAIAAAAPIHGISITGQTVVIDFKDEATQGHIDAANAVLAAFDWSQAAEDAWFYSKIKGTVTADATATTGNGVLMRSVIAVAIDEINTLRQWLAAFKIEVAAASSLADLKTRVATLPSTPDRTLSQAKTAIQNKINSGAAD